MANDHSDYCRTNNSGIMAQLDENLDPEVELEDIEGKNFDEVLIDMVKQYPHLYDTGLKDYRDAVKKENSWVEISNILNTLPNTCVTRWTRLRESFSKEKKKRQNESKSGSGACKRRGFVHFENMKFLDKFVKTRSSITNVSTKRKAIDGSSSDIVHNNRTENMSNCIEHEITTVEHLTPSQAKSMNSNTRTTRPVPSTSATKKCPPPRTSPEMSDWDDISVASYRSTSESSSNNDCEESLSSTPSTSRLSDSQHSSESGNSIRKFQKPSFVKGKFNIDRSTKKKVTENDIKNDEFEESFIKLNKAVAEHLKSKLDDPQNNDTDVSFCNLIIAELKQMDEAEKQAKKQEILQILWRKSNK